ncbi:MAG: hypothetical protein Q9P14_18105 [candidate division KSB1 bacterium]|nr:hypothetical protein [candidate division KSB1 bacterium]
MKRAKRKFGDDLGKIVRYYKSRTFGFASRNFYAEFLAALEVATDYEDYFGDVKFHQPMIFQTFVTDKYYTVQSILRAFNLSMDEFKAFNPALRPPVLRGERRIPKGYALRLPDRPDGTSVRSGRRCHRAKATALRYFHNGTKCAAVIT